MNFFEDINNKILGSNNVLSSKDLFLKYEFSKYKLFFKNKKENNTKTNYYKHVIFKNDIYEIIIIKWYKGSNTKIHSHPKNGCLLKLIEGKLNEKKYFNNILYQSTILDKNDIGYMHDNIGQHKITSLEDSYSVHLYSPPNYYNCN